MFRNSMSSRQPLVLFLITLLLSFCLVAPVFATEPEEADPDPNPPSPPSSEPSDPNSALSDPDRDLSLFVLWLQGDWRTLLESVIFDLATPEPKRG